MMNSASQGKNLYPALGRDHLSEIPTSSSSSSQEIIPPVSSDGVSDLQVVFRQEAFELTANTGLLCKMNFIPFTKHRELLTQPELAASARSNCVGRI